MKPLLYVALSLLPVVACAQETPSLTRAEELALIFRPFESEHVTLSPDGRRIAHTERDDHRLFLVIRDVDANTMVRLPVGEDRTQALTGIREKKPARITFLRWATSERLVFNLNGNNICSIAADGTDARLLADPTHFDAPPANAGSILGALRDVDQTLDIVALPRDGNHVFVQALRRDRGTILSVTTPGMGEPVRVVQTPSPDGAPLGVVRIEVETGRSRDWGEAAPRAMSVLVDKGGHPRVSHLRQERRSLTTSYTYIGPRGGKWRPLEELFEAAPELRFSDSPENHLEQRSIPLGFDYNSDVLYFASNVGRDTFGVYALDLARKQRSDVSIETPIADLVDPTNPDPATLVFDDWRRQLVGLRYVGAERATLWLDSELAEVSRTMKETIPAQAVEILEWDEARRRFLVFGSGGSDPGTYYLFERESRRLDECLSRAPWLPPDLRNHSVSFGFRTKAGVNVSGYLTQPRKSRIKHPPLVVLCHDGPWQRDVPGYSRWAQALASMGFAVLQVNYRGSSGFGQKHLHALRDGYDSVAIDDLLAAMAWVKHIGAADLRFVAIIGEGYGGYLALRAMQLHAERFRCAVTVNAPTDLAIWTNPAAVRPTSQSLGLTASDDVTLADQASRDFLVTENDNDGLTSSPETAANRARTPSSDSNLGLLETRILSRSHSDRSSFAAELRHRFFGSDLAHLRSISPIQHPEKLQGPVMIIQADTHDFLGGRVLSQSLERLGRTAEFHDLNDEEFADLPKARVSLFRKMEGFLNVHIYDYAVELGETVPAP